MSKLAQSDAIIKPDKPVNISFKFRTLEDVHEISEKIANLCPDPSKAMLGIIEMMLNAVEHGNLGISYAEKTQLILENDWHHEINKRLQMPINANKFAIVTLEKNLNQTIITIKDQGIGFAWENYLEISPDRMSDPNGKGIAISKMSFDKIQYHGNGNEVSCFIE